MRRGGRKQNTVLHMIAAVAFGVGPSVVLAQQQQPSSPVSGSLQLSSSAELDTNAGLAPTSPGARLKFSERIRVNVTSETSNQILRFTGSGWADVTFQPGGGTAFNFGNPNLRLSYNRDAANAAFAGSADYWSGDIVSAYDIDPTAGVFLVVDDGTLTRTGVNVGVQTGLRAPLGLSLDFIYDGVDYEGTTDPALFDTITAQYMAAADMRISPVTQGRVSAGVVTYEDSAVPVALSTVTTSYDFAVTHELRRALTLDANIGVQEREVTSGGPLGTRTGMSGGVRATQLLPRGDVFAGVSFDETGPANRTNLSFGHSLTLPAGSVSASLTATDIQGHGVRLLGNASYSQQLSDGTFDMSLGQSIGTNQLDEDVLTTQFGVAYGQQVTAASDLNLSFNLTRTEDGGAGSAPTRSRATFTASYDQALTPEWDMSVGYRYRAFSSETVSAANSNAIFLNLTRNIDFGF